MDPSTILQRPYPRLGLQKGHPQLPAGGLGRASPHPCILPAGMGGKKKAVPHHEPHLSQRSRPNLSPLGPSPEEWGESHTGRQRGREGGSREQLGLGRGQHTFLDLLCGWTDGRSACGERGERMAVTGGRAGGGRDRQGQGSEHAVSRLHGLLFLRSQAPAPPTHDHVCTRTHTGLKSRHIPGS